MNGLVETEDARGIASSHVVDLVGDGEGRHCRRRRRDELQRILLCDESWRRLFIALIQALHENEYSFSLFEHVPSLSSSRKPPQRRR